MTAESRNRPFGETAGSDQRRARTVDAPVLTFDVEAELATLRSEPSWERGDRNARTLVETPGLRIVLTALKPGARLREHFAPGWVYVQTVQGLLRLHAGGQTHEVPAGHLLVLEPNLHHDVEAVGESVFLLSIAGAQEALASRNSPPSP